MEGVSSFLSFVLVIFINNARHKMECKLYFIPQVGKIGLVLTLLYCMLLVPIMLLYRNMELMLEEDDRYTVQTDRLNTANNRKYPPRYDESRFHFRFLD